MTSSSIRRGNSLQISLAFSSTIADSYNIYNKLSIYKVQEYQVESIYVGPPTPPSTTSTRLKIKPGPLYTKNEIISKAQNNCHITPVTRKCIKDMAKLEKTIPQLRSEIISDLLKGKFEGSEWCFTSRNTWGASDGYEMFSADWEKRFFLKYFISKESEILAVSCHI